MTRRYRVFSVIALLIMTSIVLKVWAAPNQQANLFEAFLQNNRQDLEALANQVLGEGARPPTWTFNTDLSTVNYTADLWFDNEQLADSIFGGGQRPPAWFGATSAVPEILSRNVRHDMELAADTIFGADTRPDTWRGADKIYRCERTLQNVVRLLDVIYDQQLQTQQSVANYCLAATLSAENDLAPILFSSSEAQAAIPALALALRGDVERLADEVLGLGNRPPGWVGNAQENSPTLVGDASRDIEILADLEFGSGTRPAEWSTFSGTSPAIYYRNMRYDLELLTDASLGQGVRPRGWQGVNPLEKCTVTEQSLVAVVQNNFGFVQDETIIDSADYCSLTMFSANNITENPPAPEVVEGETGDPDARFIAEARYAFTYLDVAALQYMGIMPGGTQFRAWYRNFNESNMMFVSGQDFAVFVDQRFTSLPREVFDGLPTLEGIRPLTFCDAFWCNGPSPTPTPTGGGPLLALINAATPPATVSAGQVAQAGSKAEVTWNYIRVTYLLDRPETGTVQVALEICAEPAQIACEPVIRVFDNALGQEKAAISQYNGLNVYEFTYGYITTVIIEGTTRVSSDIWISDPTIR